MKHRIGIAIHSGKLKVIFYPEETIKTIYYTKTDLDALAMELKRRKISEVTVCGNRRWAEPLYFYLYTNGFQVNYLPLPGKERGQKMSLEETLKIAFEKGVRGQPFVKIKREETSHRWLTLVKEYFKLQDDRRRTKLRIQGILREMVPEVFIEGNLQKIFTQKGLSLLEEKRWSELVEYVTGRIIGELLINFVIKERVQKLESDLDAQLQQLKELEKKEAELIREIEIITANNPIVKYFNDAFSARLLVLAICWKTWNNVRELRKFCGLDVKRIDAKGKLRISRVHPETRAILYFILKTKKAQSILKPRLEALGRKKPSLPKVMELLLKCIWREFKSQLKKS